MAKTGDDVDANRRIGRWLRFGSREVGIMVVVIVLSECILQLAAPQYANRVADRGMTGGYPMEMTPEGNRGQRVTVEKPNDRFRLLGLGDSATFGLGIRTEDIWPAQTARLIEAKTGRSTEAICAGLPQAGIREITYAYEHQWTNYEPDIVILEVSDAMVARSWMRRHGVSSMPRNAYLDPPSDLPILDRMRSRAIRVLNRFCLPGFVNVNVQRAVYWVGLENENLNAQNLRGLLLAYGWQQGGLDLTLAAQAWKQFEQDLRGFCAAVRQDDRQLVITHFAPRFVVFQSIRDNEKLVPRHRMTLNPEAKVRSICKDIGVTYIDSIAPLRQARREIREKEDRFAPLYLLFDYAHLDREGHLAVAKGLADAL